MGEYLEPKWLKDDECVNVECWLPKKDWEAIVKGAKRAEMHPSVLIGDMVHTQFSLTSECLNYLKDNIT